jgi:similar to spore coat protein
MIGGSTMNSFIEKLTGLDKMTDQVIATDFLTSMKSAVQNYAVAITETMSPQLRATLTNQLSDMIVTYEAISDYMMNRGFYHAYDMQEQYRADLKMTETALGLKEFMSGK